MLNQSNRSKLNKWIAGIGIATILFITLLSNGKNSNTEKQANEIVALKASTRFIATTKLIYKLC